LTKIKNSNVGEAPLFTDTYQLSQMNAYIPQSGSPLLNGGINLEAQFNINPGLTDFRGHSLPSNTPLDIGAMQVSNWDLIVFYNMNYSTMSNYFLFQLIDFHLLVLLLLHVL